MTNLLVLAGNSNILNKTSTFLSSILTYMILFIIVAIAGLYSERSGTINIALEGIMTIGAFIGALVIKALIKDNLFFAKNITLTYFIAIILSGLGGALFSSLLAFAAVNMKADQTIVGTALNILATAIAIYIPFTIIGTKDILYSQTNLKAPYNQLSFNFETSLPSVNNFGQLLQNVFYNNTSLSLYVAIVVLVGTIIIFKYTRFGLRISACGENPKAAQTLGINVIKYRWISILISGFLAGMGGIIYIVSISSTFSGSVYGFGFLALSVLIFGQWRPLMILLAAFLFSLFNGIGDNYQAFGIKWDLIGYVAKIIPYALTLVALMFTSKKSRAPKAIGRPFEPRAQ